MSHSPCRIDVRSAAAALPARRWADMDDDERALPATVLQTPPVELPAPLGGGQVSYQPPAASETTETWLPAKSSVADTAPCSALGLHSFSSVDFGGISGLFTSEHEEGAECAHRQKPHGERVVGAYTTSSSGSERFLMVIP